MKLLKVTPAFLGILIFGLFSATTAVAYETYQFKRMWPTLQQPWYFNDTRGLTVDDKGNVYITDGYSIQKFSANGEFITKFGTGEGDIRDIEGIEADRDGNIYVADSGCHCIQKFSSEGRFIFKWGKKGDADGQFDSPQDIAIDSNGNVYVADTDNYRIQKFGSDGKFILKWGSQGNWNGEFESVEGIAADRDGNVYVADSDNHRIQKFDSDGKFIIKWGNMGQGDGQVMSPHEISIDGNDFVYIADTFRVSKFTTNGTFVSKLGNTNYDGDISFPKEIASGRDGNLYVSDSHEGRIQKFDNNGTFLAKWGNSGSNNGEFISPLGITMDKFGNIYVADSDNHRIQKFDSNGNFAAAWGNKGCDNGKFESPWGVVADTDGYIYVADSCNYRIQKFTSNGIFIKKWNISDKPISEGSTSIISGSYRGLAIGKDNNIYMIDQQNAEIKKFDTDGILLTRWGRGELGTPYGIAVDKNGNIYISNSGNNTIQRFGPDGTPITKWKVPTSISSSGGGTTTYNGGIRGVAADEEDNIYVADIYTHFIYKFSPAGELIAKFGGSGSDPGFLRQPQYLCMNNTGDVYVSDTGNNRIQVFAKGSEVSLPKEEPVYTPDTPYYEIKSKIQKAIIVAGGGPFPGNTLWDATRMCANYAYRALTHQSYSKDRIYYLSADTNLDLDGNGTADDVDGDAVNKNLQKAITEWSQNAENLLIYMVDHGGDGTFRMNATELLHAPELNNWLGNAQNTIPGTVTLIYDACRSGSFINHLSGKNRIVVTSSDMNQEAVFADQGTLSFSFILWARIFNAESFYDAFVHAKNSVRLLHFQTSQLDADGNGIANEKNDQEIARKNKIGNETPTGGDIPVIGNISPDQTISGQKYALIYAENVVDSDGINRVWAVITPPNYINYSVVTNLPAIELVKVGGNRYEAAYNGFTAEGIYNITIFAMDRDNYISLPIATSVTQLVGNSCVFVADNLTLNLCAEYLGKRYGCTLNYFPNPYDPAGLYWKMDVSTFRELQSDPGNCISVGSDLKLDMCAEYQGHNYGFAMNYDKDVIWKMDVGTFKEID